MGHKKTRRQVIQEFDYIGLILFSGGLLVFLMGISWGRLLLPMKSVPCYHDNYRWILALVPSLFYEYLPP